MATPRPCPAVGQGGVNQGGEPPMAKHERRKASGQPRGSHTTTIQLPLPVLGVLNGVREAFHGLCITTGLQVLQAMMEGDREELCGQKGRHQVERSACRGGSVASQVTLGGRQVGVPRLRVRSAEGEVALPSFRWVGGRRPTGRAHAVGGRRRGVDAAVCGHVGPGAGRGGGAGDVKQRGVAAVHASVGKALSDAWDLDSADRAPRVLARGRGHWSATTMPRGPSGRASRRR